MYEDIFLLVTVVRGLEEIKRLLEIFQSWDVLPHDQVEAV